MDTVKKKKIVLKKRSSKRVLTGISGFDELISGGFEEFSTNLVVGASGVGKSIFATQFLLGGLKNGERCLYITFEEKRQRFYENMLEFGIDLEYYEKEGLFNFLEYTPAKVKSMLEEGGGAVESIILNKQINRLVIDSITSFSLLFESETEKREAALSLFNLLASWNCTSLLTFEEQDMEVERHTAKALEFESDSIVTIHYVFDELGQRQRYIEISKMRGSDHSRKVHRMDIGEKGVVIDRNPCKKIPACIR